MMVVVVRDEEKALLLPVKKMTEEERKTAYEGPLQGHRLNPSAMWQFACNALSLLKCERLGGNDLSHIVKNLSYFGRIIFPEHDKTTLSRDGFLYHQTILIVGHDP